MQKWYQLWFQKTLFLNENAAVYLLSIKILFTNIKYNRVPAYNDVTITSFYFISKSAHSAAVYFTKRSLLYEFSHG